MRGVTEKCQGGGWGGLPVANTGAGHTRGIFADDIKEKGGDA